MSDAVRTEAESSVDVAVDPATAFTIFTTEFDLWWVRGPINNYDASRVAELRIEPGVGGRVLEIYDEATGDMAARERVTVWEPGERLVLTGDVTAVDVCFTKIESGTRVSVRQYLLPDADPRRAGFGWVNMLYTYGAWLRRRDTAGRTPREADRLGIALYYKDPVEAARWLHAVFQLGDWDVDRVPDHGQDAGWIEFHVGNGLVMLFRSTAGDQPNHDHDVWVHVDDLQSHFDHAKAAGAEIISGISTHGSTTYRAVDLEGRSWTFVQARPTMRLGPGPVDELAAAAGHGDGDTVRSIIARVDPEQSGLLLHRFAREGNAAAISMLLTAGVDPDVTDETGATALHHAAATGDLGCIAALVDGGADLDRRDHQHGSSPLLWARELGHPDAIRLLLDRGARVNAADAARLGLTTILDGFLTDVPRSRDRAVGWPTPLAGAIAGGQTESVRLLLERGADPDAPTGSGETPMECLRWAPDEQSRSAIGELLRSHGAAEVRVS